MATYTHGHHESVLRSHRWRTAENSAAYLLPSLKPHMKLLDVGCGPGTITADLAARVGTVTAIDTSAEVLDEARQDAPPNVTYESGDVHELAYQDGTFCVVHAHQVLQHLADPVRALREMRRVTAPGGLVAARDTDYRAWSWYPELPALDEWLDLYLTVSRHNGGQPDAGRKLLGWAGEAGFTQITSTSSTWCFATPQDRVWWAEMWAERVRDSALARTALENGFASPDQLDRIAAAWLAWSEAPEGWLSILHGELLCRV